MKTRTTLAALLLAAVMVTPSYGADESFLEGCEEYLRKGVAGDFTCGYFMGVCVTSSNTGSIKFPQGSKYGQLFKVVAQYVYYHPEYHHESNVSLVRRACKEAWPDLNKHKHTFFNE